MQFYANVYILCVHTWQTSHGTYHGLVDEKALTEYYS